MSADGVFNSPSELNGLTAYDKEGDKIGSIGQVYVDDRTNRPEWVTVKTGMFGMKESLVPLSGARRSGEGLHVPYPKETVKDAPRLDADEHLDPGQEKQLYQHYGLTGSGSGIGTPTGRTTGTGTGTTSGRTTGTAAATGTAAGAAAGAAAGSRAGGRTDMPASTGRPTTTPTTAGSAGRVPAGVRGADPGGSHEAEYQQSEELIRSEEQLQIGTEEHEVGRARLHKVVVTENVTTSVPLSHEEVHVIHEAILPEDRAAASSRIGEAEAEVTLHAEQPIIRKEAVAVERVRMETERVTETKEVSSDVRKEEIEYDSGRTDKGMGDDLGGKRGPRH
ncbi:PRC and DUF2382 domain-containing protein [Streptomyces sp. NPDC051569]|uniref:PRC and DUF2382 domain-containing protein n=1 Tax=Streptomyces sp. NPDC051569 TaxID=3365661 RepID=UPI00379A0285